MKKMETDIIVAAAGLSGLAAAISAATTMVPSLSSEERVISARGDCATRMSIPASTSRANCSSQVTR